jgi:molybdopterin molybdotransferase
MIGFDEAQALLAARVSALPAEQVELARARGRVLAEPIRANLPAPRRDVSAMDGYAVRNADAAIGARFWVIGESFAGGELPPSIGAGEAVRIFTGAALPAGADRVIMQENCTARDGMMTIAKDFGPGWHVRRAGSDFAVGDLLLDAGRLLDPRSILTLAAADRGAALVYRKPKVAIIATGDELVPPGTASNHPLAIPESVSFGVAALAEEYGAEIALQLRGADDLTGLKLLTERALATAQVVVVTGGASVGERDCAKAMFADHDPEMLFSKVAIKPGKPVWMAQAKGRWIVGLPGNPTSAMVTARLFLAPLLGLLQGRSAKDLLDWSDIPIAGDFPMSESRTTFVRATLSNKGLVPLTNQDSGAQAALAASGWLVRCDPWPAQESAVSSRLALRF